MFDSTKTTWVDWRSSIVDMEQEFETHDVMLDNDQYLAILADSAWYESIAQCLRYVILDFLT